MQQAQLSFELEPPPALAAAELRPRITYPAPQLLIHWKPFWPDFTRNVSDFLGRRDAGVVPTNIRAGEFWPDVFVQRPLPWKELAQSSVLHILIATFVALTSTSWLGHRSVTLDNPLSHTTITYYKTEAFLPEVKTAPPRPSRAQSKHDPVKALQEVISVPNEADNSEQTIANLAHPEILQKTEPLPNMIVESPKVAVKAPSLTMPALAFKPVMPTIASVHEAVPEKLAANAAPIEVRAERAEAVAVPKLELQTVMKPIDIPTPAAPAGPAPTIDSAAMKTKAAVQLLVLNARPVEPNTQIQLPDGSRNGVFAASPLGREGAAGTPGTDVRLLPQIASGGRVPALAASGDSAPAMPSGISVAGPKGVELASAITPGVQEVRVQRAVPRVVLDAPSAIRPAVLANATNIPRETNNPAVAARRPTDAVFGAKRVYQMQINLPNLTSAGGSWIIRFAEMSRSADTSELSTPVATMQVDPAYPQTLQSDGVQGTVVLYAVIHADGTVGDVRVLHGVHERLDDNAMKALSRWKFRPATKSGSPVEIEAVVQIPFYARRAALR